MGAIRTEAAEVSLQDAGILVIRFQDGVGLEPSHVPGVVAAARRLAGSQVHGNLVDIRGLLYIEQEAREAFAAQSSPCLSGIAILLSSGLHRTLANLYLSVSRPRIPTRMFTSRDEAVRWLLTMNEKHTASR
jgi:hypothetical protein